MMNRKQVLSYFEENKDFFENTVLPNIEKYRKGKLMLCIRDEKGAPIDGAKIKVKQTGHEFKFGANIFMLDELETEEKNRIYKERFKSVFNMATLPFYWNSVEEEKGNPRYAKDSYKFYRRPAIDLCIEFCEENGIEPREHALAYEHTFPSWLSNASVEEIKQEYTRRCEEISERYADKIRTIEVTNEMLWPHDAGVTRFYNEPDYIEWCFKTAEKYFPKNQLVINEYTGACWGDNCRTTDAYYSYIEANKLKGARIDAIGAQFHMFESREDEIKKANYLYNPLHLYDHMNMYSNLINHLQVTEITVPSYSNEDIDEEIQAKLIEYLYTMWFSHPAMEQIIYWNLVDGYAYVSNPTPEKIRNSQGNMTVGENVYYGGLLRFDMSPKPAFETLDRLINEKWHTELCGSAEGGSFEFLGFYGEYEIEIKTEEKTVTKKISLSKNRENKVDITL
ncbi:MAG: endo-1,4-beta-xylanase [Clostridia bacterium]|nr:endo-1,4-beta-xylanase [Clostridia bacterium]